MSKATITCLGLKMLIMPFSLFLALWLLNLFEPSLVSVSVKGVFGN